MKKNVLLAFTGDYVPSNISEERLLEAYQTVDKELGEYGCHDLVLNLEASLPFSGISPVKTGSSIVFGDRDLFRNTIKSTDLNFVFSLANNHMADYGISSIKDTKTILAELGVQDIGAADNSDAARNPLIVQIEDISIGLIAFCSTRKCVGDHLKTNLGMPISLIDKNTTKHVTMLSDNVDHVVVICHWGREFIHYPIPEDRTVAHSLIDAGASLIIGHHPHVLQGYEKYKKGLIFYSLGNFIFPEQQYPQVLRWNRNEQTGSIAVFQFAKQYVRKHSLIPLRLEKDNQLIILEDKERMKVLENIEKWSTSITYPRYERFFEKCVRTMVLKRTIIGIIRNIFKPRKKHISLLFRLIRQGLQGRKTFVE